MQSYYKTCKRCHLSKLIEEFQPRGDGPGRRHICSECKKAAMRVANLTPEANKHRKNIVMKSRYGITLEEYEEWSATQKHVCAICQKSCNTGQPLSVDHCHDTGKVRGLLCRKCNVAIGTLKTIELLQSAIDYLKLSMSV